MIRSLHWLSRAFLVACAAACVRGTSTSSSTSPSSSALVITNATILDPSAASPATRGSVVVQGDRIVAVGGAVRVPSGATIVDGSGKFLLPGLWDMHAHIAALTAIGRAPEQFVGYGVLGVRDMGSLPDSIFALRDAVRRGARIGPELVVAGPTLNGIQAADFHRMVTTDAEARAAVHAVRAMGADFVKVHRAISREAFLAIADETRKLGLHVVGHVPLVMSWREASNAGMYSIEHIQTIYENEEPDPARMAAAFAQVTARIEGVYGDSIFTVLARNATWFDPTLVGYENTIQRASPAVASLRRAAYARMKIVAAHAARVGVPLLAGTDVLDRHGDMLLTELERLVEIGLTPQQALAAATSSAATAAGRPRLARIAVGNVASFVLLDADPIADIRNARALHAVVLRGRLLSGDELARLRAGAAPAR